VSTLLALPAAAHFHTAALGVRGAKRVRSAGPTAPAARPAVLFATRPLRPGTCPRTTRRDATRRIEEVAARRLAAKSRTESGSTSDGPGADAVRADGARDDAPVDGDADADADALPADGPTVSPTLDALGADDGPDLLLSLDGERFRLRRSDAAALREALGEALVRREEYVRTSGEYREDGSYVVARRGAESAGHSKVFRSFAELERLYGRLPAEFTASEVGRSGLTGGRRHMLVRHFAEHPAFDCELTSRQPLTARKRGRFVVADSEADRRGASDGPG
jgi:hypothetical protein